MRILLTLIALVSLNACTFTTDEAYIRCLQGFNDSGSGGGIPGGAASTVITAGAVGAGAALLLCKEPEVLDSPDALDASVSGDLSQDLEERPPLLAPVIAATPKPEPVRFMLDSRALQFDLDKAQLMAGADETLSPVVEFLRELPEVSVRVVGHTCWLGNEIHNQDLSERRAQAVADYLEAEGIEPSRLVVEAYGESQPIADNRTDAGRQRNRRVEVIQI